MIMNKLYTTPTFTGKADVDSRSAPAPRWTVLVVLRPRCHCDPWPFLFNRKASMG